MVTTVQGSETVLLAEDEDCVRELLQTVLERAGYCVFVASRPSEAMRLLGRHRGHIQLLVTDVVMPEMDGIELARRVVHADPGVRILYMSGYDEGHRVRSIAPHAGRYLQKPFEPDTLLRAVREVLDGIPDAAARALPQRGAASVRFDVTRDG